MTETAVTPRPNADGSVATFIEKPGAEELPLFMPENLPDEEVFSEWRKTATTWAVKIDGPFAVQTQEGTLACEDGWLALDSEQHPYPIASSVFADTYEPAIPDEIEGVPVQTRTEDVPDPTTGDSPQPRPRPADEPGETYQLDGGGEVRIPDDQHARRTVVELAPASEALVGQLAHRVTFLEIAQTQLVHDLVRRDLLTSDYLSDLQRHASRELSNSHRDRATTPGTSGLVGLELAPASDGS